LSDSIDATIDVLFDFEIPELDYLPIGVL